jgi:hypothetical protein
MFIHIDTLLDSNQRFLLKPYVLKQIPYKAES